jgi:hypothetical protein
VRAGLNVDQPLRCVALRHQNGAAEQGRVVPNRSIYGKQLSARNVPLSAYVKVFGRASRANQCPVSGVKQPCRRNPETAEFDPNRTAARLTSGKMSATPAD